MKCYKQVAAFILAGGASSRMGANKALLRIAGVPLLVRTVRLIQPLVGDIAIVGRSDQYPAMPIRKISDRAERADIDGNSDGSSGGPLRGIVTALTISHSPWNLIVACDLPYLSEAWLAWLLERAVRSRAKAVVPRSTRGLEPLVTVYRRDAAAPIAVALSRGLRKVTQAIEELSPEVIDERAWHHLDPRGLVLRNMNTPEDYAEARRSAPRLWNNLPALLRRDWRRC